MATCARIVLKDRLLAQRNQAHAWFENRFKSAPPSAVPFYSSFDLRDADYKVAPVDANLFPAGFNNICDDDLEHDTPYVQAAFKRIMGRVPKSVLLIPENHTRNQFYVENLYELRQLLRNADIRVELGWWENDEEKKQTAEGPDHLVHLKTPEGHEVIAHPVRREGDRLVIEGFDAEAVVINNDYSAGYPPIFDGLKQPVFPSPRLGWHTRRKDRFFHHYNAVVADFAKAMEVDPWAFTVATEKVTGVDFVEGRGIDAVADAATRMLDRMRKEYAQHNGGKDHKPFVFIKNNAGTYGIGVMKISDPKELYELNRRDRNKMQVGKGNRIIDEVIVQEGIPTRFVEDGVAAEPVIYMMGTELIGGFLRKNPGRGAEDNLNSRGMVFQKLCMADLRREADRDMELELVYGTLARLSAAALIEELKESL
jgi:glutamate--cysteine ligase